MQKQGDQYVVPTERACIVTNKNDDRLWLAITETEYNANNYVLYVWAEPYAVAALSSTNDRAMGRIELIKAKEKYRGLASGAGKLHASVKTEDLVITHDIFLTNSVVQFIVDEMNTNAVQPDIQKNNARLSQSRRNLDQSRDPFSRQVNENVLVRDTLAAEWDLGHRTHKNEDFIGALQDIYFRGGGEWDHKPVIFPVWGTDNRLGNRHAVYYYDGWSNMHFGLIAAKMGLPLQNALRGAGQAQGFDNIGSDQTQNTATGDDEADAQAIAAGYNLGLRNRPVTRDDVLNILYAHPGWLGRTNKGKK